MILLLSFSLPAMAEWKQLSCKMRYVDSSATPTNLFRYDPDTGKFQRGGNDGNFLREHDGSYVNESSMGDKPDGEPLNISRIDGTLTSYYRNGKLDGTGICVPFKQAF